MEQLNILYSKIRENFGGRIKVIIVGSAPLPSDLAKSIKIFFSVPIIEAYGMTEASGAIVSSHFDDHRNLTCGGSVMCNQFKLIDVPELNYHSKTLDIDGNPSPSGEICAKGFNIMAGYFRDKKILPQR